MRCATVTRSLANCCRKASQTTSDNALLTALNYVRAFLSLAFSLLTLYPSHNFLLQLICGDVAALAFTAYSYKCTEWIVGYVVEGILVTSVAGLLLVVYLPTQHEGGLASYMKTFEVTIREEKTGEELDVEW